MLMKQTKRDILQVDAAETWLGSGRKATILAGTGVGKSKITMIIMEILELPKDAKILLLVSGTSLRDSGWKDDFAKWGLSHLWDQVQAECYQTVYKWSNKHWDLVIADEIDFSLTEKYAEFYSNNTYDMLLGLTGTVTSEKEAEYLNIIAPVVFRYSTQQAQDDDILNKTQLVLVEFDLSMNKKDIAVPYKKYGKDLTFYQSENDAYNYADTNFNIAVGKIRKCECDIAEAQFMSDFLKIGELEKELQKHKWALKKHMSARKTLLNSGIAGLSVAKRIKSQVLANATNKIITFSMLTDQADKISAFSYHGKNKKNNTYLKDLSRSIIRELSVCKAINRGENIVGLNNMIMESFDSSETQFQQRHGRGCRLLPNQTLYLYVMLPYFHREVKDPENPNGKVWKRTPTQAVKWAEGMMKSFKFKNPIRVRV